MLIFQQEVIENLSLEMRQKQDFLISLLNENDWSMIIKCHALIETLVTELIIVTTKESKLKPVIERLPLSDEEVGKLKIAKDYGLTSSEQRTFIRRISTLRNDLVHKYENINFDLKIYIKNLDKNQLNSWKNCLTWYTKDDEKLKQEWSNISVENPKLGLWFSIFMFVSFLVVQKEITLVNTQLNNIANETTEKILKNI